MKQNSQAISVADCLHIPPHYASSVALNYVLVAVKQNAQAVSVADCMHIPPHYASSVALNYSFVEVKQNAQASLCLFSGTGISTTCIKLEQPRAKLSPSPLR